MKRGLKELAWRFRCAAECAVAVVQGCAWALVPAKYRREREWVRRGIRLIRHTPSMTQPGFLWCIKFGLGAGYIGGAGLYLGWRCQVRCKKHGGWKRRAIVVMLTNNGGNAPLPGYF